MTEIPLWVKQAVARVPFARRIYRRFFKPTKHASPDHKTATLASVSPPPAPTAETLRLAAERVRIEEQLLTNQAECNLCGHQLFGDMGRRIAVRCLNCNSLERTRIFRLFFEKHQLLTPGMRVLHLAPERGLARYIRELVGDSYVAADYDPEGYKDIPNTRKIDLTLPLDAFERDSYDMVLHSHVLEHIPANWSRALKNLNDLLKPGGYHICCIPILRGYYEEDLSPLSADEATRRFGQYDHVRRFGTEDLHRTLGMVAPLPQEYRLTDMFSAEQLRKNNIPEHLWEGFNSDSVLMWRKEEFML